MSWKTTSLHVKMDNLYTLMAVIMKIKARWMRKSRPHLMLPASIMGLQNIISEQIAGAVLFGKKERVKIRIWKQTPIHADPTHANLHTQIHRHTHAHTQWVGVFTSVCSPSTLINFEKLYVNFHLT